MFCIITGLQIKIYPNIHYLWWGWFSDEGLFSVKNEKSSTNHAVHLVALVHYLIEMHSTVNYFVLKTKIEPATCDLYVIFIDVLSFKKLIILFWDCKLWLANINIFSFWPSCPKMCVPKYLHTNANTNLVEQQFFDLFIKYSLLNLFQGVKQYLTSEVGEELSNQLRSELVTFSFEWTSSRMFLMHW